tara:strand:- start:63 stop:545 length:483 start_codon:yes stop_codon:yes gene_type:complete
MKLFPNENFTVELRDDRMTTLNNLKHNTKLSKNLVSEYTEKEFIGQIDDCGFKIISSEIGRGAVCVFIGDLQDSFGNLEIRIHNAFKIMFSILMLMPFVGFGIVVSTNGIENSIGIIIPLIIAILFVKFVFMELSFRFISKTGINKLNKIIGIKTRHNTV